MPSDGDTGWNLSPLVVTLTLILLTSQCLIAVIFILKKAVLIN